MVASEEEDQGLCKGDFFFTIYILVPLEIFTLYIF